jgi:hypothetical protein
MIGCSGVVACLGVVSRLNFGVGGLPVGKLGVKTESGSGFASPREGAVNTLEVKIAPSSEFGSSDDLSELTKELDSDVLLSGMTDDLSELTKELDSDVLLSGMTVGKSELTKELGLGVLSIGEDNITALAADVESLGADS